MPSKSSPKPSQDAAEDARVEKDCRIFEKKQLEELSARRQSPPENLQFFLFICVFVLVFVLQFHYFFWVEGL